jgi:hypothetical protein
MIQKKAEYPFYSRYGMIKIKDDYKNRQSDRKIYLGALCLI